MHCYNSFLVNCRELAPGTVSLTGGWAQGDDSKHDSYYTCIDFVWLRPILNTPGILPAELQIRKF